MEANTITLSALEAHALRCALARPIALARAAYDDGHTHGFRLANLERLRGKLAAIADEPADAEREAA